jgi:TrmH family RNA methyltransferase
MNAPKVITSLTNDRVKAVRALEMRKVRKETGLFLAEGTSLVITARDHGFAPETLVYQTGSAQSGITRGLVIWALKEGAEVLEVSEAILGKLASKDNPQTVLGVFKQRFSPPPESKRIEKAATWLALEEIRDPGNLGTIIRTADAAGAAGIILAGTCCDPYALECVRATMGSIFAIPLVKLESGAFLELMKAWPGDTIATDLAAAQDFRSAPYRAPELIVMGSEGPGLSQEAASAASLRVKIPMAGELDSLNLAIATALTLYQVRANRLKI